MTIQTETNTIKGLVQDMRVIRDQISNEIKDMTFEEERAYLDKLLYEDVLAKNKTNIIKE